MEKIVYHRKKIKSDINEQVVICNKNNQVLAMYGPDGNGYLKNIEDYGNGNNLFK